MKNYQTFSFIYCLYFRNFELKINVSDCKEFSIDIFGEPPLVKIIYWQNLVFIFIFTLELINWTMSTGGRLAAPGTWRIIRVVKTSRSCAWNIFNWKYFLNLSLKISWKYLLKSLLKIFQLNLLPVVSMYTVV